ncbi:CorA metal ion transporter [Terramyces sp. JEL0728]|nr:CorA metal ion transporter [Terramyces sp. JEL0728]
MSIRSPRKEFPEIFNSSNEDVHLEVSNDIVDRPSKISSKSQPSIDFKKVVDFFDSLKPIQDHAHLHITFYSHITGVKHFTSLNSMNIKTNELPTLDVVSSQPFWIDVSNPTHQDMQIFANAFDIHQLTIDDIMAPDTRQKADSHPKYNYILVKSITEVDYQGDVKPIPISMFHKAPNSHTAHVANRLVQDPNISEYHLPDYLCYLFIDDITSKYLPYIRQLETEVDSIDDLVLILKANDQSDMLSRISKARKRVMKLQRLINSKPELIKLIANRLKATTTASIMLYFEDVYDHAYTMKQDIAQFEMGLSRSHSHYLAQINIEITQASNRGNEISTNLTTLASVLVPYLDI